MQFGNHEQTLATIIGSGAVQIALNILSQRREAAKAERERQIKAAEVAAKLEEERINIAREVAIRTAELRAENERHMQEIKSKIQENTDVSVKAFDAANHVNDKISGIQEATMTMLQDHLKQERIERVTNTIKETTNDIQERVVNIEGTIVPSKE